MSLLTVEIQTNLKCRHFRSLRISTENANTVTTNTKLFRMIRTLIGSTQWIITDRVKIGQNQNPILRASFGILSFFSFKCKNKDENTANGKVIRGQRQITGTVTAFTQTVTMGKIELEFHKDFTKEAVSGMSVTSDLGCKTKAWWYFIQLGFDGEKIAD